MAPEPAPLCLPGLFLISTLDDEQSSNRIRFACRIGDLDCLPLNSWPRTLCLGEVEGVATGVIFAAVFVPAGVGAIVSAVLRTRWGLLLNLPVMMSNLWQRLLGAPAPINDRFSVPTLAIGTMLSLAVVVCLGMLNRRIRAREVVRG